MSVNANDAAMLSDAVISEHARRLTDVSYWAFNLLAQEATDDALVRTFPAAAPLVEFKQHLRDIHGEHGMVAVESFIEAVNRRMCELGAEVEISLGMRTRAIPKDPSLHPGDYGEIELKKRDDDDGQERSFWF